ncbi:MAG: hypothetical protein IMY86_13885 [Chloroflexi bacterium]|nr:hypothetical protein [Chloroflexota bacterium]
MAKLNGTVKTFVPIVGVVLVGLGLGWGIVDKRIDSEVRAIKSHGEWVDTMIDGRIEVFESRAYADSQRLARIEQSQVHMQAQLKRIEDKLDDL